MAGGPAGLYNQGSPSVEYPVEVIALVAIGLFIVFLVWVLPVLLILNKPGVSGKEKAIWIFAVFFVSWLSWVLFLFVAPVLEDRR